MPQDEITGKRNLNFSKWHRRPTLPEDCTMVDVDCVEYCHYCGIILALIETTECRFSDAQSLIESARTKCCSVTERLAIAAKVPCFVVSHTPCMEFAAIHQPPGDWEGVKRVLSAPAYLRGEAIKDFIDGLHDCGFCKKHRGGRFRTE